MNTIRKWTLFGAMLALLTACMAKPNPVDVAADRDRWVAVRATTADGVIDATEKQLLDELLATWDATLRVKEAAAGPKDVLADMLRIYGVAAVQVLVGPELLERAPELFRLVDANSNGILEESELLSMDPASQVTAVVVITSLQKLLKR